MKIPHPLSPQRSFLGGSIQRLSIFVLAFTFALSLSSWKSSAQAEETEVLVDTVVASVSGDPITLQELCGELNPPRELSFQEAANDPEARSVLDSIILERLIEMEAEAKRVDVADPEIERYIDEVAQRNQLSREGFEQALKDEGKSLENYRRKIRVEILKSKLVSNMMKSGPGVGEKEIDEYLEHHPELIESGSKLKLSQIFLSLDKHEEKEARELLKAIKDEFSAGESFAKLAMKYSDSPDGASGGSLGVLSQEDLNPQIFDAVFSLAEGEISEAVSSSAGLHVFWVEKRFGTTVENEGGAALRTEVRRRLEQDKLQEKMQMYFTTDLYKAHSVDKKI